MKHATVTHAGAAGVYADAMSRVQIDSSRFLAGKGPALAAADRSQVEAKRVDAQDNAGGWGSADCRAQARVLIRVPGQDGPVQHCAP
jgi:hypothetical protein